MTPNVGLDITANRLFGPQPRTATYLCLWNISVGRLKGIVTTAEGRLLLLAVRSFLHGFSDPFNVPASTFAVVLDRDGESVVKNRRSGALTHDLATFLKLTIESIDCTWMSHPAACRLVISRGVHLDLNNLAGTNYRKVTSINVPDIQLQTLFSSRPKDQWLEAGRLVAGCSVDIYNSPKGWRQDAEVQMQFLKTQDKLTGRLNFLQEANRKSSGVGELFNLSRTREVAYAKERFFGMEELAMGRKL